MIMTSRIKANSIPLVIGIALIATMVIAGEQLSPQSMHLHKDMRKSSPPNYQVKTKSHLKILRQQELLNILLVEMERQ